MKRQQGQPSAGRSSFGRATLCVVTLVAFALVPVSCRQQSSGNSVIIITPHPETLLYEYRWAFQSWYRTQTGRDVDVILLDQGGTSKMLRYLYNEFERSPAGVNIDIVWGGGTMPYHELIKRDLLHAYRLPRAILESIPLDYSGIPIYDSRHRWYGSTLTGFGIVYNRRVLELQNLPEPKTWTDLAEPAWQSWIGWADPRQSGSSHMTFEIILQAYGWEKGWETIARLGANINTFTRLASDVPTDTALGEIACGPSIDSYAYAQMAFSGPEVLGYVMPEGLTVVNPDGIGILKGAPNLETAQKFLEFVMSQRGQHLLMAPVGVEGGPRRFRLSRMSVLPQLYERLGDQSLVRVNPFRLRSTLHYDAVKASTRRTLVDDMIGSMIIENHDELKAAWRAVGHCEPKRRAALTRQLARVPVAENEALDLAREKWDDPVARNRVMLEWARFARIKYDAVLHAAQETHGRAEGAR